MAISKSNIDKVAYLARLQISTGETEQVVQKLDQILKMVDQLQNQDTTDIAPLAHPLETSQFLRPDIVDEKNLRDRFQSIAPAVESGLYLVPRVID